MCYNGFVNSAHPLSLPAVVGCHVNHVCLFHPGNSCGAPPFTPLAPSFEGSIEGIFKLRFDHLRGSFYLFTSLRNIPSSVYSSKFRIL